VDLALNSSTVAMSWAAMKAPVLDADTCSGVGRQTISVISREG
jgi:hypothetical protein